MVIHGLDDLGYHARNLLTNSQTKSNKHLLYRKHVHLEICETCSFGARNFIVSFATIPSQLRGALCDFELRCMVYIVMYSFFYNILCQYPHSIPIIAP